MTRLGLVLLALLVAAPPARAQLGIDLGAPPKKEQKQRKEKKERRGERRSKERKKRPAAPPREHLEAPPPAPAPEPEREAAPVLDRAPPAVEARPQPEAPPPAAEPAPVSPRTPPPPVQAPGLSLTPEKASPAAKARLDAAKKLLDEGATETAALAFDQILREPGLSAIHDEALYQRAKALARLGLGHSALAAFDRVLERGPTGTRFYPSAMEWLFHVGRGLVNEQPLMARVARHAGQGIPPSYEDRVAYLLGKYEFERGRALLDAGRSSDAQAAFADARRQVAKVRADGPSAAAAALPGVLDPGPAGNVHARAKFVDGLVLYAEGDDEGAIEGFKDVVRLTNPRRAKEPDPELRELAFLQLARIHYQNRQNRYAIFYYGKMPWGGERWLEGLWEASYAHYRIGDYEKALGNLLTLQSPYFADEYFPESYILKAIVYYENCRYPEARAVIDQFSSVYEPVYEGLVKSTAGRQSPEAYWELVGEAARGAAGVSRRIRKVALSDQNVHRLGQSIEEIEREMDAGIGGRRPEFRQSGLGKELLDALRAEKLALVREAGARARAKLEYERDELRQLLAQALRIQIEVSRKEREALEGALAKGSQVDVVRDLKYSHAVSDEHLYWPYEGEFWRDELGTYSYTLTKGCKDRLPRSRTAAR